MNRRIYRGCLFKVECPRPPGLRVSIYREKIFCVGYETLVSPRALVPSTSGTSDGRGRHVDLAFRRCLRGRRLSERGCSLDAAYCTPDSAQLVACGSSVTERGGRPLRGRSLFEQRLWAAII